jgi:purine-binding chemotaxis protein CheW
MDRSTIYQRPEATRAALEGGVMPTPEDDRTLLGARAQALARESEREAAGRGTLEVVEFQLGDETYGIESSYVREVSRLKELTPLPCTPAFVLGIINVRGQILSVIDLKKFFDLPKQGPNDLDKVIVVHNHTMIFGILAHAVVGVRSIARDAIQPSLPILTGIRAAYPKGVIGERLIILDADVLLSDRKLIVLEEVDGAHLRRNGRGGRSRTTTPLQPTFRMT